MTGIEDDGFFLNIAGWIFLSKEVLNLEQDTCSMMTI